MIKQEELIERCKRRDPAAYTSLYNQHAKEVYNTILRLVGHTAQAEDILQESFVAAFERIDSFADTGGFRAWIKRIAINKSVDWLRKKKIKWVELEPDWTGEEEEEMVDEAVFGFTIDAVMGAINALPEGPRTVFNLFVMENMPQAEIATMLGLGYSAVRTQYHRAKNKILTTLREEGYEYER
jgi:RNA polymerase sigma factor (sigma-70 family)